MEPGYIVEYIDRQKILCAVILENKNQKLHLLNELNRELNLSSHRILHSSKQQLKDASSRDGMIEGLKATAVLREALAGRIDIPELWEILHEEKAWLTADFIAGLCFSEDAGSDHEAAVIRALFRNRLYFKFDRDRFYPYTPEQVEQIMAQKAEEERKKRLIEEGGKWLKSVCEKGHPSKNDLIPEFIDIIKSLHLFGKESPFHLVGREMMKQGGIKDTEHLFPVLVRLGVYDPDENIELLRLGIQEDFPEPVALGVQASAGLPGLMSGDLRKDMTHCRAFTIDGQGTRDFDDALSVETDEDRIRIGIHIADVGHYVKPGDPVDDEALNRGSSIYMPDKKIPMLPPALSEDICSLKADEIRPAISVCVSLTSSAKILEYDLFPSIVRIHRQLTYDDVNALADKDPDITMLRNIAEKFRQNRLSRGAVQISLPETQLWLDDAGELQFKRIDRESPGRMLVAELMIMANWLKAKFLGENRMPAVFRNQPPPKELLYKGAGGTLFQNYMQRRLLSRFRLSDKPEPHSGLGLDAYVTATSPIRKYYDLITQRQIRSVLGIEKPMDSEGINQIMGLLQLPLQQVARLQVYRNRYWMLKYLEKKVGQEQEAMVLMKRKNRYQILLTEFMIECDLPASNGIKLKPEDLIHVKIQHVDAKKNILSVFL